METHKVVLHNVAAPDKNHEMFSKQNVSLLSAKQTCILMLFVCRVYVRVCVSDNVENDGDRMTAVTEWPSDQVTNWPSDQVT